MSQKLMIHSEKKGFLSLFRDHRDLFEGNIDVIFKESEDGFFENPKDIDYVLIDQSVDISVLDSLNKNTKICLIGDRKPATKQIDIFFQTPLRLGEILDGLINIQAGQNLISNAPKTIHLAGDIQFSPRTLTCKDSKDNSVVITEKEAQFLLALYESEDKTLDRKALLQKVWEYADSAETHTLETHVYRLRQKLNKLEAEDPIETVENGYCLKLPQNQ